MSTKVKTSNRIKQTKNPATDKLEILSISEVLPQTIVKGKRGRPSGSRNQTFVPVNLSTLNQILGVDSIVMVSRKYADLILVNNITALPVETKPTLPETESPGVTVTEFSDGNQAGLPEVAA